jgi:thioesterase domain-containing protein
VFASILAIDLPDLSATASFFDLGGTSLDILKLTRALERRCGIKGGLPIVLQNPSVRHLATHISSQARRAPRKYDPFVPLQVSGHKVPLFCVHPGNGEIFSLVNVAKYFLNDRPFYALRPPGFNDGEQYFSTVRQMVSTYVDAIMRVQPQGSYAIAGYSLGCSIAYEVAQELEARGRQVAFLAAIDGRPRRELRKLWFNMATGLALVIDLISREQYEALNKELAAELPSAAVCEHVFSLADPQRVAELNLDLERFTIWARVAHSIESMLYEQLVNSGRRKRMTIFRGEGYSPRYWPEWSSTALWRKELMGWNDLVDEPRYLDVPGQHFTIMGPKHVAGFQAVLRAEIDDAFAR